MVLLVSTAFALTIPVRATLHETVEPGERPGAGVAAAASVAVSHATKGTAYRVTEDELTAVRREAAGRAEMAFAGDPSGSVHTWAIYPLDQNGKLLAEPSVVDVSFDDRCTGSLAARQPNPRATDPLAITVTCEEGAIAEGLQLAHVRVTTLDGGVDASFLGIAELGVSAGSGELSDWGDMSVMNAAVYAAYQSLDLDVVVPLTDFRARLDGDLTVEGLTVGADGRVEGGDELAWDVTYYADTICDAKTCTAQRLDTLTYLEPVGAVKKRSTTTARVALDDRDVDYDVWGGGLGIDFAGDLRGVALSASAEVWDGERLVEASDVIALDPSSLGVTATLTSKLGWKGMTVLCRDLTSFDARETVVTNHFCQLAPTPATLDGRTNAWTGTCTADDGAEVRRIRARETADGMAITIEMGGSAFAAETTTRTCDKSGTCTETTTSLTSGSLALYDEDGALLGSAPMAVTETSYDLGFAWKDDITGLDAQLAVELDTPDLPGVRWEAKDDTLVGTLDGEELYTVDVLATHATDRCDLGGADLALSAGGALTTKTGPGQHKCRCKM